MINRYLKLKSILKDKSVLLLGPRQTGKSTLVASDVPDAFQVNLAEADTFRTYSARPELLRERLPDSCKYIFIDEAQLLPEIFNEVQVIVDRNPKLRIILTGSSARKIRRGNVNLLPGRVWQRNLHPLVYPEIPNASLADRLLRGGLPGIFNSENYQEELRNYVGLYLEQEIRSEGLTRSVGDFSRFLTVAALTNTEQLNFSNISNDTGVKLNTVRSYYQILQDTLIGYQLDPVATLNKRKLASTPKFYFFDIGVVNGILGRNEIIDNTEIYGKLLEHLVFLELKAYIDYKAPKTSLYYWRTVSKLEVDFVINKKIAIDVKNTSAVRPRDEKPLNVLEEDIPRLHKIIVCNEKLLRKTRSGVHVYPLENFLEALWKDKIIDNKGR